MRQARILWLLLVFSGCGPGALAPSDGLTRVDTAPLEGQAPAALTVDLARPVEGLGRDAEGTAIAVAGGEIHELASGQAVRRQLYSTGSDPSSLGALKAIAPRSAGGAWLVAANGLFLLEGSYASFSPLSTQGGTMSAVSDVAQGSLAGLWLSSESAGLLRWKQDAFERYVVEDLPGPARALAITSQGNAAFALLGDAL
jgi:hypothetical protein